MSSGAGTCQLCLGCGKRVLEAAETAPGLGALSASPSNCRAFTVCLHHQEAEKLAWHRSNVSNEALALASILKLGFCKSCKSPEEMLEHRRACISWITLIQAGSDNDIVIQAVFFMAN